MQNERQVFLDRSGGVDDESLNYENLNIDERYAKMERHINKGILDLGRPPSNYPSINHTKNRKHKKELKGNVLGYGLGMMEDNAIKQQKKIAKLKERAVPK